MNEFLQVYKIDILIVVVLVVAFLIFRKTKVVRSIVLDALSEVEMRINTDLAQKNIDDKVRILRGDKAIPFLIRKCITKYVLITIMEKSMNIVADVCELDREFDLKGNDDVDEKRSMKIELGKDVVSIETKTEKGETIEEPSSYIYAEAKAKTDFRGESSGEISVGIKKKI